MKLLSWALAGHACYNIPSLAIPDQDLRTIRSKVKTPGDMAKASPACRLVSLMPFASDRSQPGPVNSHDPGASRQARLWFYAGGSPRQPPTTMSISKCDEHTSRIYREGSMCQQRALSSRPKGRGTPRVFGRREKHATRMSVGKVQRSRESAQGKRISILQQRSVADRCRRVPTHDQQVLLCRCRLKINKLLAQLQESMILMP
jgi:hypothetical protein